MFRVGATVIRPTGAHSPAVQAFLRHLERKQFEGVPRLLATDESAATETLSFLEGETTDYPLIDSFRTDRAMVSAAQFLRRLHDASLGFDPSGFTWFLPPRSPSEVICHGVLTKCSDWSGVISENVAGLQRLSAAGVPVGVVSNNDGTAPEQLLAVQVAQVGPGAYTQVSVIIDSGIVGVSKPDPAIFAHALEAMGVSPNRALYVGDTPHADVRGARAAGMPVVQLDPYNLYAGWDHPRVPDVGVLVDLLLG